MSVVQKRKLLLSELAALGKSSFTTSWSAKDHVAASAHGGDLSMGEDGLDLVAAWAFDIHEVGVGALH